MKHYLLFVFLTLSIDLSAQISCKTKTLSNGSTEKTCLHKNGKVSTLETWDTDQRFGNIKGFDSNSKELFSHSLRNVGGHASASIEYFSNGQVSKIYFSDAPDGGIQFYNSTTKYNELGEQTDFYETKYPNQLELEYVKPIVQETRQVETKTEEVKCAAIAQTCFEIQNATNSTVKLKITAVPNKTVTGQSKEIELKPTENVVFDTLFTAEKPISEAVYKVEILSFSKSRKSKKLKIVDPGPIDQPNGTRVYYWFVMKG